MAATVTLDRIVYTRILSETLSEGRTATATMTAVGTKATDGTVTKATTLNFTVPSSMTEAELTVYQTFVSGLDEIATELEAALYVESGS